MKSSDRSHPRGGRAVTGYWVIRRGRPDLARNSARSGMEAKATARRPRRQAVHSASTSPAAGWGSSLISTRKVWWQRTQPAFKSASARMLLAWSWAAAAVASATAWAQRLRGPPRHRHHQPDRSLDRRDRAARLVPVRDRPARRHRRALNPARCALRALETQAISGLPNDRLTRGCQHALVIRGLLNAHTQIRRPFGR